MSIEEWDTSVSGVDSFSTLPNWLLGSENGSDIGVGGANREPVEVWCSLDHY